MRLNWNLALLVTLLVMAGVAMTPASAASPEKVLHTWNTVVLRLVRHTPTYSPPVASRAFAYLGVTAYEAVASGSDQLQSLAGQLNGLDALPQREAGQRYNESVVIHAVMNLAVREFFGNTGPTGQRVIARVDEKLGAEIRAGVPADVIARSEAHGRAITDHILRWSLSDGGAVIENMGFPYQYRLTNGDANWVPTSTVAQQQMPLLPGWGKNRTFAMPDGASCPLPEPPPYSEDRASRFYREALEVYDTAKTLTVEQRTIARFWSDDPMLSPTPPGHWMSIALDIMERDGMALERRVDVLARLGIAIADSFIGCWNSKFQYDLLRPVTYIRRVIDPKFEPLLITPPFPEYPSGHSTQSGAAAAVLTEAFGENFAFADRTHEREGLGVRSYPDFWTAANEAGISRLYGGIHFRAAIERGLDQGRCVGAHVAALRTRR